MEKKAMVITHGGDPDGIISAALMYMYLCSLNYKVEFVFVIYSTLRAVFDTISRRGDLLKTVVFVGDLCPDNCLTDIDGKNESIIGRLTRKVNKLTWVDHHSETLKHKNFLESLGVDIIFDDRKCTSALIFNTFFSDEEYFHWLSQIAQRSDYPGGQTDDEIGKIGQDLYNIISLHLFQANLRALEELVITLSRGYGWYNNGQYAVELRNVLTAFEDKRKSAWSILKKSLETIVIDGQEILFGYGPGILPDKKALAQIMAENVASVECCIILFGKPLNNVVVLRSSKSNFPVINFCRSMGGGGRIYGERNQEIGGFSFSINLTQSNFTEAKKDVINRLNNFLTR